MGGGLIFSQVYVHIDKYFRFLILVLLPYILVRISIQSKERIKRFLLYFAVGCVLISITSLINLDFVNRRIQIFEINQIPLATAMGIAAIILTMFLLHKKLLPLKLQAWKDKKIILNSFISLSILLVLIILFLTQTRGVVISLILSAIIGIFIINIAKKQISIERKYIKYLLLAAIIILIIIPTFGLDFSTSNRFKSIFSGSDPSTNARIKALNENMDKFTKNPIIGTGMKDAYPHNIFVEILTEGGIIGFIIFMAAVVYYFRVSLSYLCNTKKGYHLSYFIFIITIMLLIEAQFSFRLDAHKWLFMFMALNINTICAYFSNNHKIYNKNII